LVDQGTAKKNNTKEAFFSIVLTQTGVIYTSHQFLNYHPIIHVTDKFVPKTKTKYLVFGKGTNIYYDSKNK
jgi:hypothetical protein